MSAQLEAFAVLRDALQWARRESRPAGAPLSQPRITATLRPKWLKRSIIPYSTRAMQVGPEAEHEDRLRRRTGNAKRCERRQPSGHAADQGREVRHSVIAGCSKP